MHPNQSELGQSTSYDNRYNPERLFPIARASKRVEIGVSPDKLPFKGFDCWNHYEVSWLNPKGKPVVAVAQIIYDCNTPYIIESKSLKLYFNSFNNTSFDTIEAVAIAVKKDLESHLHGEVIVHIQPLNQFKQKVLNIGLEGQCLDDLDIECSDYLVNDSYLATEANLVEETLYSDLLKSNCLVTNQPDWGSVQIAYTGKKINHEGLLKYLVSFRDHNEFHEQCIERIFMDIMRCCKPNRLTVYGRYTRRGGLDINPYRSTDSYTYNETLNNRLVRQ